MKNPKGFCSFALALYLACLASAGAQTFNVLSAFMNTNGAEPASGVTLGTNGNLYGTTVAGGVYGVGTVFMATPSGKVSLLASFAGTNGSHPYGALVQGADGNFYGTTSIGGDFNLGTAFSITPGGVLTTLASFDGTNGAQPYGALEQGSDGNFYGTASAGGNFGAGTVFVLATNGVLTRLVSFDGTNGALPFSSLELGGRSNSVFFGTASSGGGFNAGTIFSLSTGSNATLTKLYSFTGGNDGAAPEAGLLLGNDGNLYGTTAAGGTNGLGTVFQFTGSGGSNGVNVMFSFAGTNGSSPYASLMQGPDTNFYGTTISGGTSGHGTVFRVNSSGTFTSLRSFSGGGDGANPYFAGLTQATNGNLYGVTSAGGRGGVGTLYELSDFPPFVVTNPVSLTVEEGATVMFSVVAAGSMPLTYRWQLNSNNLSNGPRISGVITPTVTISNVTTRDAGSYSVVVKNSAGTVSSAAATLTVVNPPIVGFRSPGPNAVIKTPMFTVVGSTTDNVAVTQVYFQFNGGDWRLATPVRGWSQWNAANLSLSPGTNVVQAYAVNGFGLISLTNSLQFIYSTGTAPMGVSVSGPGSVSPDYNGKLLNVFQSYSITARPASGYVVSKWTATLDGSTAILTDTPQVSFAMESNLTLQVTFVPSPFIPVSGNYSGLFYATNRVAIESSGFFTFKVTPQGTFSGYLQFAGQRLPMSGRLHLDGSAQVVLPGPNQVPIFVSFQLDLTGATERISGSVSSRLWVAGLVGDRAVFDGKTNIAPQAGRYTMVLAGSPGTTNQPGGDSYGIISVDKAGRVQLSCSLADGTRFSQSALVSSSAFWPLFAPLYSGQGSVLSWIMFSNAPAEDLNGQVSWIKPALPAARFYPQGFAVGTSATGSLYQAPGTGTNVLSLASAQLVLTGGDLGPAGSALSITNPISFGPNNRVTNEVAGSKLSLSFSPGNGLFHGQLSGMGLTTPASFSGVALQKPEVGQGYFLGAAQSGEAALTGP